MEGAHHPLPLPFLFPQIGTEEERRTPLAAFNHSPFIPSISSKNNDSISTLHPPPFSPFPILHPPHPFPGRHCQHNTQQPDSTGSPHLLATRPLPVAPPPHFIPVNVALGPE